MRVSRGGWVLQGGTASLLAEAYQRTPGGYVAFLDESFELEGDRKTFYLMSAVVTHRDQIEPLRDGLRSLVGGTFWHTTQSLLTDDGRQRAIEIAEYLGDENGNEVCIVSCKMPIGNEGGDAARQGCFRQVAENLCSGTHPLEGPVHLMVLEQRETQHERSYDTKIVRDLRSAEVICRQCQLKQASPRDEHLLWLPDLVSSAVRRSITHKERDILDPIAHIVQLLECP
jgi:hypothetical protein